jgi:hypothetical protein
MLFLMLLAAAVPQWSVHEIEVQGSSGADIQATFSGPRNTVLRVRGFWDGGRTHRVRWTPTLPGTWQYDIKGGDSPVTGSITASAPSSSAGGFVRRDPEHPNHFRFDNGSRYYMFGTTYYELLRNARAGNEWKHAVARSQSYGINKVRMLVNPAWNRKDNPFPTTSAFQDRDHGRIDPEHFRALDRVIRHLQQTGVVADLILFTNADGAFGTEAQDRAYARYVLARYGAYSNVIWCLTNEWNYTKHDRDYWNRLGRMVADEDPYRGRLHSIHQQTRYDWNFDDQDWYTHKIVQLGVRNRGRAMRDTDEWASAGRSRKDTMRSGDDWGWFSIVYNRKGGYPVVNDEYGYIGEPDDQTEPKVNGESVALSREKHRRIIWGIACAGGYAAAGDKALSGRGRAYMTALWRDAPEYEDIRHLVDFWTKRGIQYWRMQPRESDEALRTRTYTLALEGEEYVTYAAAGGEVSVRLAPGMYSAERFDPRNGEAVRLPDSGGGDLRLALPPGEDFVLHFRRKAK